MQAPRSLFDGRFVEPAQLTPKVKTQHYICVRAPACQNVFVEYICVVAFEILSRHLSINGVGVSCVVARSRYIDTTRVQISVDALFFVLFLFLRSILVV